MLYLVATPIGNLADFSHRAIETLKRCDYILCEDTRHSSHLLKHYDIHKPLKSYHAFNENKGLDKVIDDLNQGLEIALISDAGTPLVADPGYLLVRTCREKNIPVSAIPGPCAAVLALILSGFPPLPFQCVGFLPKKQSELKDLFPRLLLYPGTTICYESPQRIQETLTLAAPYSKERTLCVVRELTKLYEECLINTADKLLEHFSTHSPRGEIALLFSPPTSSPIHFEEYSLKELVSYLEEQFSLSVSEAIKLAADLRSVSKKTVYKEVHIASSH